MREIKFRVWKTEFTRVGEHNIGEMAYDVVLANPVWNNADIRVNDILAKTHNLMQYSGLKDKNGKEIYESDVIEIKNVWTNGVGKWSHFVGKVVFFESEFQAKDINDNYLSLHRYKSRIEVIGNIYEHSHLLDNN